MKQFLLFFWHIYGIPRGWDHFVGSFATLEEAQSHPLVKCCIPGSHKAFQIVDSRSGEKLAEVVNGISMTI